MRRRALTQIEKIRYRGLSVFLPIAFITVLLFAAFNFYINNTFFLIENLIIAGLLLIGYLFLRLHFYNLSITVSFIFSSLVFYTFLLLQLDWAPTHIFYLNSIVLIAAFLIILILLAFFTIQRFQLIIQTVITLICFGFFIHTIIEKIGAHITLLSGMVVIIIFSIFISFTLYIMLIRYSRLYEQNDILTREISHRVKNDTMVISDVVNHEIKEGISPETREILESLLDRIGSYHHIHTLLYNTIEAQRVDLRDFIHDLASYYSPVLSDDEQSINIDTDIPNITVASTVAISFGLIVNELLTNSKKHAFKNRHTGEIKIEMKQDTFDYLFFYHDNGVGTDTEIDPSHSFGYRLIYSQVEKLRAKLEMPDSEGFALRIRIPYTAILFPE